MAAVNEVQYEEVLQGLQNGSLVYLDVRNFDELKNDGKVKGSVCVPLPELDEAFKLPATDFQAKYQFAKPAANAPNVVVACRSGRRAVTAISLLEGQGYNNLKLYSGSFLDWQAHGGPLEQ